MKLALLIFLIFFLLCFSKPSWWSEGHQITGNIAQHFVNSQVKEKMKHLFHDESLGAQATWADEIKGKPEWKFSNSYHYSDFHNNSCAFFPETDCKLPESCIVHAIYNYTERIRHFLHLPETNETKDHLSTALRFVIHFLGDIHQPLHIGRAEDLGGNKIHVNYFGKRQNLHSVIDGEIILTRMASNFSSNPGRFIAYLISKYTSDEFINTTTSWFHCDDKTQKFCPDQWANESARIACDSVYPGATEGQNLTDEYYQRMFPIIEAQLMKGGLRLAHILNYYFQPEKIECEPHASVQWWEYILNSLISLFLICFAGLMSGLTLGLLSIDPMQLKVLKRAGTDHEKKLAARIQPLIKNHHYLLVTLLLMNALSMESLPLFLDKIVPSWMAIVISVSMVLLFGEIIPQAVCARYGLQIGAYLNFLVLFLMVITFPISFPISLLLDKLLGKDHITFYRRSQLKSIIDIHGTSENSIEANGPLSKNEMQVIRGALDLQEMVIERLMRPIQQTFMIDVDSKFDQKTIEQIQNNGYSRIPVFKNNRNNVIGYLVTKLLIGISIEDNFSISDIRIFDPHFVNNFDDIWSVFHELIQERKHLAFVQNEQNELMGIVTLEDILEELFKEDILDEGDEMEDLNKNI